MANLKTKLSTLMILIFISGTLYGQLNVEAGRDTIVCEGLWGIDPLIIGGNPTASGGEAPYVYSWETTYKIGSKTFGASLFLDDPTKANPTIVNAASDVLKFIVTVTDKNGTIKKDSISIRFSSYGYTAADYFEHISQGDTVILYHNIGLGIKPLSYSWTPDYNISDASVSNPKVWPEVDTDYTLVVTDSVGCVSNPDVFEVYVNPLGLTRSRKENIKAIVFPNPIDDRSKVYLFENKYTNLEIQVINPNGQVILSDVISSDSYEIGAKVDKAGLYRYLILSDKEIISSGQVVKKY